MWTGEEDLSLMPDVRLLPGQSQSSSVTWGLATQTLGSQQHGHRSVKDPAFKEPIESSNKSSFFSVTPIVVQEN